MRSPEEIENVRKKMGLRTNLKPHEEGSLINLI